MTELKPCPFCGGYPKELTLQFYETATYYFIMCTKCNILMKSRLRDEVIENWNKRV